MFHLWVALVFAEGRPTKLPKSHVRGKQLYEQYCFPCHGSLALSKGDLAEVMNVPPLAGRIKKEGYPEAIQVIQQGKGNMPAYEMTLDKHDSKRILIYLSRLDPTSGLDPNPEDYEDTEQRDTKTIGEKAKAVDKSTTVVPKPPDSEKKDNKRNEQEGE